MRLHTLISPNEEVKVGVCVIVYKKSQLLPARSKH